MPYHPGDVAVKLSGLYNVGQRIRWEKTSHFVEMTNYFFVIPSRARNLSLFEPL